MKAIYKYRLYSDMAKVVMPAGAKILCADTQHNVPHLWALVDPAVEGNDTRVFAIFGTGEEMPDHPGEYIGTIQQGPFVWHIFEAVDLAITWSSHNVEDQMYGFSEGAQENG